MFAGCLRRLPTLSTSAAGLARAAPAAAPAWGLGRVLPLLPLVPRREMSIHKQSMLRVVDNTGASYVQCIGHVNRRPARLGDLITVVVKKCKPESAVTRKEIVKACVVRQRNRLTRPDGSTIRFQENSAVLLKRDLSGPIGSRVIGPVARELRAAKQMKIVMMAYQVV